MKKNVLFVLLLSCFVFVACGKTTAKQNATTADTEKTTTSKSMTTTTTTTQTTQAEETEKIESFEYEVNGEAGEKQLIKETVVYKGDQFLKLEVHITTQTDEATKTELSGVDFETVRAQMLEYFNGDSSIQQLKAIPGVEVESDVTPEYDGIVNIKIDMTVVDLKTLSSVEGMGADFTQFAELTPKQYILGLKLQGAKAITQ